jgi:O2-independent ubiquinone biosynthesis accessory factor UbiT
MNTPSTRAVPRPLGALLARLPAYPGSVLLATALNVGLAPRLPEDVRQLLLHRKIRIHVRDARLTFDFGWEGQGFRACGAGAPADLTISAIAHDFMLLAQRREDPDTLFFSRRLAMEGDTELGLVVKNALDAMELPVFDAQQWAPQRVFAALKSMAPPNQRAGVGPRHPRSRE